MNCVIYLFFTFFTAYMWIQPCREINNKINKGKEQILLVSQKSSNKKIETKNKQNTV